MNIEPKRYKCATKQLNSSFGWFNQTPETIPIEGLTVFCLFTTLQTLFLSEGSKSTCMRLTDMVVKIRIKFWLATAVIRRGEELITILQRPLQKKMRSNSSKHQQKLD